MGLTEVPESRTLLAVVLLADMVISSLREIIEISDPEKEQATLIIVTYALTVFIFCGSYSVGNILHLIYQYKTMKPANRTKKIVLKCVSSVIQITAAVCYLYGDNYNKLRDTYITLGNDENNSQIAAFFCLGVAFIIFHVAPPVFKKCFELTVKEDKHEINLWLLGVGMIAVMAKIDMLYSVVFENVKVLESCNPLGIFATFAFIVICSVLGSLAVIVYYIHAVWDQAEKDKYFKAVATVGMVIIIICIPLYIIGDNTQPLDCAFNCTSSLSSVSCNVAGSGDKARCIGTTNSTVRIVFNLFTLSSLTFIIVLYSCFWCCTKRGRKLVVIYNRCVRFERKNTPKSNPV